MPQKQPLIPPRTLQEVARYVDVFASDASELCQTLVAEQARHAEKPQLCSVLNRMACVLHDFAVGYSTSKAGLSPGTLALLWPTG
jgi:hypothetical protein